MCDAHYRFILVDIGDAGRHSDGGVLCKSISDGHALPGTTQLIMPYAIVADEAFPFHVSLP